MYNLTSVLKENEKYVFQDIYSSFRGSCFVGIFLSTQTQASLFLYE